jgi:hypothetical protein
MDNMIIWYLDEHLASVQAERAWVWPDLLLMEILNQPSPNQVETAGSFKPKIQVVNVQPNFWQSGPLVQLQNIPGSVSNSAQCVGHYLPHCVQSSSVNKSYNRET